MPAPRIITARRLGLAFADLFGELGPEFFATGDNSAGARARNAREGVALVRAFHAAHEAKGWGGIGYHCVIPDDGALICARPTLLKGKHRCTTRTMRAAAWCANRVWDCYGIPPRKGILLHAPAWYASSAADIPRIWRCRSSPAMTTAAIPGGAPRERASSP